MGCTRSTAWRVHKWMPNPPSPVIPAVLCDSMPRRFSIRTILFGTAMVAIALSVYVHNANARAKEQESIDAIVSFTSPGATIVSEPGVSYQTDGGVIWLEQTGPSYGSFYGFDIFRRVTMVKLVGEIDARVVGQLRTFRSLRIVWLNPYYRREHAQRVAELRLAVTEFRQMSPNVEVDVEDFE